MPTDIAESDRTRLIELLRKESSNAVPDAVLDEFIGLGQVVELPAQAPLVAEGDVNTNVYALIEGVLRSWHWDGEVEHTDYFGMAGTLCVCYHCYLWHHVSPNTIEACCPSRLLRVSKKDFDQLLRSNNDFAWWVIGNLQCQNYYYEMKHNVIKGTARERYEALVKNRPELLRNVPLKVIASYLGITPAYLSRLRAKIK